MLRLGIVISGYTKSKKSTVARMFGQLIECGLFELSAPIREELTSKPTLRELLDASQRFREHRGINALAVDAADRAQRAGVEVAVFTGVRRPSEVTLLRTNCASVAIVFVHSTPATRYARLDADPTSIARGTDDYELLDRLDAKDGVFELAKCHDFVIINEQSYPITPLEQVKQVVARLGKQTRVNMRQQIGNILMSEVGVVITRLPVYTDDEGDNSARTVVSRLLKPKGELATLCVEPMHYIAYVEFPLDGEPRANHFHEEKIEYLYLAKGKVRLFYRRGGCPNEEVREETVVAGSLVAIQPGYSHAYITVEPGFGVEFSPTSWDIISRDKVRDYLVRVQ